MSSAIESGASPRRFISSDGPHGILVIGSIPETGEPSVTVRMNATEIVGSLEACIALKDALEEVVTGITDAISDDKPLPCDCKPDADDGPFDPPTKGCPNDGNTPRIYEQTVSDGWFRLYRVECPICGLHTRWIKGRVKAITAWNEGHAEGCR